MASSRINCLFGGKYLIIGPCEASRLYKCVQKDTLKEFVCKVIVSKHYQDYLSTYLLLDGCPGINGLEDVIVGPRETLIVFEQSFGDLHSYLRQKHRLHEVEAAQLFSQIAQIVAQCHRRGIVLRDLKLRKFVFQDPLRTKIKIETLDDAIVLKDEGDDWLSDKHGCPAYVSPELLSSVNGGYSGRSADCWSLGVILYTLLAGRYPFHDNNTSLLLDKIRLGSFQVPSNLTPLAKCLIRSLLRQEPTERLTAEDLLDCKWFELMASSITSYCRHHKSVQEECESSILVNQGLFDGKLVRMDQVVPVKKEEEEEEEEEEEDPFFKFMSSGHSSPVTFPTSPGPQELPGERAMER